LPFVIFQARKPRAFVRLRLDSFKQRTAMRLLLAARGRLPIRSRTADLIFSITDRPEALEEHAASREVAGVAMACAQIPAGPFT
jgi:hypothetical protein